MGIADVARTLAQVPTLLALKKGMQPRPLETRDGLGAMLERTAAAHGARESLASICSPCGRLVIK